MSAISGDELRMRILIAEDDVTSRKVLEVLLGKWGYEIMLACDGDQAWEALQSNLPPDLAVLDWMMPGKDGVEICRRVRETQALTSVYIILLTAKGRTQDIVEGLAAGANDYVTKPFDREELRARIKAGERIVGLQSALAHRIQELEAALKEIKTLEGLLPICAYCKRIRDDRNDWRQMEVYIAERSQAHFSHGICPECYAKHVRPELDALQNDSPPATNES